MANKVIRMLGLAVSSAHACGVEQNKTEQQSTKAKASRDREVAMQIPSKATSVKARALCGFNASFSHTSEICSCTSAADALHRAGPN
jgi:hypothetical protein